MPKSLQISSLFHAIAICLLLLLVSCKHDTEAPVLRLKGADTLHSVVRVPIIDPGYIAFDKEDLDIADKVVFTDNVDLTKVGTYQRIYTVTDAAGNTAQATRTIVLQMDWHAIVGTYRSSNQLGICSGYGISQITVESEANQIVKISPAIGYFAASNNYIRLKYSGIYSPLFYTYNLSLPCSYYANSGTGSASVYNNGDSIHVFVRVTSTLNGSTTYFSEDYVRQ